MKKSLPVLVFQKVGKPPLRSRLKNQWTTPQQLTNILTLLTKRKYHVITPNDLNKRLPARPILLVFVGGYQSFYTEVFPLLQKFNIPATCAVAVETLGTYNAWQDPYREPWQNVLTSKQLTALVKSGLVNIATLGLDGKDLSQLSVEQAQQEVEESIHRLNKLHQLKACAAVFWPGTPCSQVKFTPEFELPVITGNYGFNSSAQTNYLRILRPTWLNRLRLRFQK